VLHDINGKQDGTAPFRTWPSYREVEKRDDRALSKSRYTLSATPSTYATVCGEDATNASNEEPWTRYAVCTSYQLGITRSSRADTSGSLL
jgi:hypothetical protein